MVMWTDLTDHKEASLRYLRARMHYASGMHDVACGKARLAEATMGGSSMFAERVKNQDLADMREMEVALLAEIIKRVEASP